MKTFTKQIFSAALRVPLIWCAVEAFFGFPGQVYERLVALRKWNAVEDGGFWAKFNAAFPDRIVRNGPFQGMRYPFLRAVGSSLFPKLCGSYESELHQVVERCLEKEFSMVLDIGCAEGYYAVGFALRQPTATVYAYDISQNARSLCAAMAEMNGVPVKVEGKCTEKDQLRNAKMRLHSL